MKKSIPLNQLSLDELLTKKKQLKGAIIGLGSVMLVAALVISYIAITKKQPALLASMGGCAITLFPLTTSLMQLNKEIKLRSQK